jgi:hypothetical protein
MWRIWSKNNKYEHTEAHRHFQTKPSTPLNSPQNSTQKYVNSGQKAKNCKIITFRLLLIQHGAHGTNTNIQKHTGIFRQNQARHWIPRKILHINTSTPAKKQKIVRSQHFGSYSSNMAPMETPHIPTQKISKNFKKKIFQKTTQDRIITTRLLLIQHGAHTQHSRHIQADSSKKPQPGETSQEGTPG